MTVGTIEAGGAVARRVHGADGWATTLNGGARTLHPDAPACRAVLGRTPAADALAALAPDAPALTAAGEALALLHAAPSAEPARCRACLRLAVLRLGAVEAAARRVLGIEARP